MTLADDLADWTDLGLRGLSLGRRLGVFKGDFHRGGKAIFWTDNALGNGLHEALLALVSAGVLERRDEPDDQFRWAQALRASEARSGLVQR